MDLAVRAAVVPAARAGSDPEVPAEVGQVVPVGLDPAGRADLDRVAQGVVELFAWETEPGYALHILNYTNPNMTRGAVRRFYTVGPQKVEFEVGRTITTVRALGAGRSLAFKQTDRTIHFESPAIADYEVIALT